jgi:hypothetical protein
VLDIRNKAKQALKKKSGLALRNVCTAQKFGRIRSFLFLSHGSQKKNIVCEKTLISFFSPKFSPPTLFSLMNT